MNTPSLCVRLAAVVLAAGALWTPAADAAETTPADGSCIALGEDQQIVRAHADRDVLLRNGDQHYRVVFTQSCNSAVTSRRLALETQGDTTRLCSGAGSVLKTDRASCTVERVEPLEAAAFQRLARQRSR